jgi:ATP-binding cassette subfamily B protein
MSTDFHTVKTDSNIQQNNKDNASKRLSMKENFIHLLEFIKLCFGTGRIFILTLSSLIITAVITLTIPFAFRILIDQKIEEGFNVFTIGIFLMLIIGLALGTALRYYSITITGEHIYNNLREKTFNHLLRFSEHEFTTLKISDIMSRLLSDTEVIRDFTGSSLSIAIRNILLLVGGFTMMLFTGFFMTLSALFLIPFLVIPIIFIGRQLKVLSKQAQEKLADANGVLNESLYALSTIQNFNQEHNQLKLFLHSADNAYKASRQRIIKRSILTFCIILFVFVAILAIVLYGSYAVGQGTMSVGAFTQFILYSIFTAGAAAALSEVLGSIYKVRAAYDRLNNLLLIEPKIQDPEDPKLLGDFKSIEFQNLSFQYENRDSMILSGVNLQITAGQKIGLVGLSGSGKTTLLKLLLREINQTSGHLLWNDNDIAHYTIADIRQQISYVSQNIVLFSGTVMENIAFASPKASMDQVIAAAKDANLHEDIMALPMQYQSTIGERGFQLSGGQRQRVAIARGVLKNASIWILDEPTSALDSETESKILTTLSMLTKDKTVITVTHRLKTLSQKDIIYVLEGGDIVESGTHIDLWHNNASRYKQFFNY